MSDCKETFRAFDMEQPVVCTIEGAHVIHLARDPVTAAQLAWGDLGEEEEGDEYSLPIVADAIDDEHRTLLGDIILAFDDAGVYHDRAKHPDWKEEEICINDRVQLISMICLYQHLDEEHMKTLVQRVREGRPVQKEAEDEEKGHASPYEETS